MFLALCVFYLKLRILHPGDNRCSMQLYYCKRLILYQGEKDQFLRTMSLRVTKFLFFKVLIFLIIASFVETINKFDLTYLNTSLPWWLEIKKAQIVKSYCVEIKSIEINWTSKKFDSHLTIQVKSCHFEGNFVFSIITCELIKTTWFFFYRETSSSTTFSGKKNKAKETSSSLLKALQRIGSRYALNEHTLTERDILGHIGGAVRYENDACKTRLSSCQRSTRFLPMLQMQEIPWS